MFENLRLPIKIEPSPIDGVLYILDFDRYDRNADVLIGRYENNTYAVSRSKRNELVKILGKT